MTKRSEKTKATVNPTSDSLNYDRMTHDYFCPQVSTIDEMPKIPTVDELIFLGKNNITAIRECLRHEEDKVRKQLASAQKALSYLKQATPELLKADHASDDGIIHCSWHGRQSDMSDSRKPFSCEFGKDIADWCEKNPHPCDGRQCFKLDEDFARTLGGVHTHIGGTLNGIVPTFQSTFVEEIEPIVRRFPRIMRRMRVFFNPKSRFIKSECKYHSICSTAEPFAHQKCVFNSVDQKTLDSCLEFLQNRIDPLKTKLDFVAKYMHNITEALKSAPEYQPLLSSNAYVALSEAKPGNEVVCLKYHDGFFGTTIYSGVVSARNDDSQDPVIYLYMEGGWKLEVRPKGIGSMSEADSRFLKFMDYYDLLKNPDFCNFWIQNTASGSTKKWLKHWFDKERERLKAEKKNL